MTTAELRELDAWIAENVFEKKQFFDAANKEIFQTQNSKIWNPTPFYSTDPAAAMEVLKKCYQKVGGYIWIQKSKIGCEVGYSNAHGVEAETLELAICLFAKKLFTE